MKLRILFIKHNIFALRVFFGTCVCYLQFCGFLLCNVKEGGIEIVLRNGNKRYDHGEIYSGFWQMH